MLRALGLGALLFGFWVSISGHYTPLLLSFGVGSSALVVYLAARMDVVDHEGLPLHLWARLWRYLPWLMKEIFVSNVAVARIILSRELPISPVIVRFHGSQATDLGRVLYANSITLTPGTITTGVEGRELQVHALARSFVDGMEEGEMDRRVTWVENER